MKRSRIYLSLTALPVVYGLLWLVFHDTPAPFVEWDIPTDPFEKQAYDFAHSIKLPDSVPKPVPFKFCKLNVMGLCFGKATSEEYFDHLCKTEAGEYIFRTADKVEGLYQMRPMPKRSEALMRDQNGFEDPADWSLGESERLAESYVNPPWNGFAFLESKQSPEKISKPIWRKEWVVRSPANGSSTQYWRYSNYVQKTQPMVVEPISNLSARYGYTWRGIRRPGDRELGIAGGELIVLDLQNNDVLGVRRSFAIAKPIESSMRNWEFAYFCPTTLRIDGKDRFVDKTEYPYSFIIEVLKPINYDKSRIHIN